MKRASVGAVAILACAAGCSDPRLDETDRHLAACRHALRSDSGAPPTPMSWLLPPDDARRSTLDAYCAAVGPALVHAPADTGSVERAPADALVIVAWNMALGEGDVQRLIRDVLAGMHTGGQPVRELVLLLQEAPRAGRLVPPAAALPAEAAVSELDAVTGPDIVAVARGLGMHLVYVPSLRNGRSDPAVDHGNAILSTLPLADPAAYELPAGIRRRVAVGAYASWPQGAAQPLHLVSVHLDNFALRRLLGSFGAIRTEQARALRAMLPTAGPLVVGGDLNTWARGPAEGAFRELRQRLPRPAEPQPEPTATRIGTPRQLDYLLLSAPAEWRFHEARVADRYGSDHNPVLGVLVAER